MDPRRTIGRIAAPIDTEIGAYAMPYLLVGMYNGGHSGRYASDFVDEGEDAVIPGDTDFNAGIGVTLPVDQILEVLNQGGFKNKRSCTIAAKKRQSGFRLD